MNWRHKAVCRDEDPELFFPIGNTGPSLVQIEEAKAVCRRCPVIEACLRWAIEHGEHGVWGGTSDDERSGRITKTQSPPSEAPPQPQAVETVWDYGDLFPDSTIAEEFTQLMEELS